MDGGVYSVKKSRKGIVRKMLREASTGGVPLRFLAGDPKVLAARDVERTLQPFDLGIKVKQLTKAPRRK